MHTRPLGRTGVQVTPLCLGTMMFGAWGKTTYDESRAIIDRALDAGINFVDTADVYSNGESEEIVGRALQGRRDAIVLATKVHMPMDERDPNMRGNSRRWIVQAVEQSLRRLRTDWIDLYQVHRWDPETDHEETLAALTDLQRAGKIRYLGSSRFPSSAIVEAQWAAERGRLARYTCEQPPYSLLVRGIETDVLPTCERHGLGVVCWSPLASGWLSGQHVKDGVPSGHRVERTPARFDLSKPANQRKLAAVESLSALAAEVGVSLVHLALAFVIRHRAVTSAIVGPRTLDQLEGQLGAADLILSDGVLDGIDEIVPPGVNVNIGDAGWRPRSLDASARRRRLR